MSLVRRSAVSLRAPAPRAWLIPAAAPPLLARPSPAGVRPLLWRDHSLGRLPASSRRRIDQSERWEGSERADGSLVRLHSWTNHLTLASARSDAAEQHSRRQKATCFAKAPSAARWGAAFPPLDRQQTPSLQEFVSASQAILWRWPNVCLQFLRPRIGMGREVPECRLCGK